MSAIQDALNAMGAVVERTEELSSAAQAAKSGAEEAYGQVAAAGVEDRAALMAQANEQIEALLTQVSSVRDVAGEIITTLEQAGGT